MFSREEGTFHQPACAAQGFQWLQPSWRAPLLFPATWPSILTKLQGEIRLTLTHSRPQPGNSTASCPNPSPFPGGRDNNGAQGLGPAWSGTHGRHGRQAQAVPRTPHPPGDLNCNEREPHLLTAHTPPAPRVASGLQVALTRWQTSRLGTLSVFFSLCEWVGGPEGLAPLQREPLKNTGSQALPDLLILSPGVESRVHILLKTPSPKPA